MFCTLPLTACVLTNWLWTSQSPDMNATKNRWYGTKHFLRKTVKPQNIRKNLYGAFYVFVIPSCQRNVGDTSASQESDSGGYFISFHHSSKFCNICITSERPSELTNKPLEVMHRNEPLILFSTCVCWQLLNPVML